MDQPPKSRPSPNNPSPLAELHQTDADEDDENVKQLRECSSSYLALQDCLVNSNRNWKSCQKGTTVVVVITVIIIYLIYFMFFQFSYMLDIPYLRFFRALYWGFSAKEIPGIISLGS
ncbi:hypothetical protein PHJA_001190500 [Phtheirospermum japonicum]|uniref:Uncharacterized protein n=1 Tax=Phtheirospermum japonicum TaxID=374723 RepID=A0A830BUK7_9LAMI|nr:hypothetical protein PHJA_001190500 [Phtheirospermum japonicum]